MIRKAGMELGHFRRRPREKVVNIAKRYIHLTLFMCFVSTELSVIKTCNEISNASDDNLCLDFSRDLIFLSVSCIKSRQQHFLKQTL